ncbi:MAG: alpha/beta fold hydrolase [Candidatus Micrarchaeota archaeon]
MKVFLFHCWGGDGRSCWSGWLQDELRVSGLEVLSPDFPETQNPELSDWLATVRKHVPKFEARAGWVFAGHSLGCPTILRLLESFGSDEQAELVILVAGFAKDLGIPQIRNFVEKDFDWEKIRSKAKRFVVINSDNDPYIQLEEGERLAKLLNTELITEHGAGHINEGSGFTRYPRVLEIIERNRKPEAGAK